MRKVFFLFFTLAFIPVSKAQNSPTLNSAEILLAMEKLKVVSSVLYIAAHPDDENTRLLGYLSREKNLRTGYLAITRGDGGQNLIGREQGDLLGLIRTQELLAARRTDGAEQFFTRAGDFGYSKSAEETFDFWNKDSVLSDVVFVIRQFKPDVIINRFPTTGEGGHGHHTASAILAIEAFEAAADPTRFSWQLQYVDVWRARRLFWNTFNFGSTNTTSEDQVKMDVGIFNPLLGKGFGEISAESRSMHKSQGFGSSKTRGAQIEYFKQLKGDSARKDVFDGIDIGWRRVKGAERIPKLLDAMISKFQVKYPEKSLPALLEIRDEVLKLSDENSWSRYWKKQKLTELENIILSSAGLWLEATVSEYSAVPGEMVSITSTAVCRNNFPVLIRRISFENTKDSTLNAPLKMNELFSIKNEIQIISNKEYSSPFWLKSKHDAGLFHLESPMLIGKAENSPSLYATFHLIMENTQIEISRPVFYKFTDPVRGEVYRNLEILPPLTIQLSEPVFVFASDKAKKVSLRVKANVSDLKGKLQLKTPDGWSLNFAEKEFTLSTKGEEVLFEVLISPLKNAAPGFLEANVLYAGKEFNQSITRINYEHIPNQFQLSPAEAKLLRVNVKLDKRKIGYIPGAGDDVAEYLSQIGYEVSILNKEILRNENLAQFDAIITGIRAYNTDNELSNFYPQFMEYVKGGGNFIVQYNTNSRLGPVKTKLGPYPFTISRERVTDETAEVRFLQSNHSVMNFPNAITSSDFDSWIQERGIYFASDIDSAYTRLFSMNDANEKASEGSTILANYGKGNFVYTGLAFFRQLPAGVPGAYRLFANFISLPKNK